MTIIHLSKWTGKSRRVPRNKLRRGTCDPFTKLDQYVVLFPNGTMISVYDEKSYKVAEAYGKIYEEIMKKAIARKTTGEALVYHMLTPHEDKLGKEEYILKTATKWRRKIL